jgi:hypothetical protein
MRTYPVNSPEAAARVLAMAMVADGQYSLTEMRALDRQHAPALLGLSPEAFKGVVDDFCHALLQAGGGQWTGSVDPAIRDQLMREITDPHLQDQILLQCEGLMLSDGHLANGEVELMDALSAAWRRPVLL